VQLSLPTQFDGFQAEGLAQDSLGLAGCARKTILWPKAKWLFGWKKG